MPPKNKKSFAIWRCFGGYEDNRDAADALFEAQKRHPGLIDEIWFCESGCDPFAPLEICADAAARANIAAKAKCRKLKIKFGFQQGVTLNHAPDGKKRDNIPEDAWAVDHDGKRRFGLFCATSPYAKEFNRRKSAAIIKALGCDTYWPDDDLRNDKACSKSGHVCFCNRCLKLFSEEQGRKWTRKALVKALFGDPGDGAVRKAWTDFNGCAIGRHAEAFRQGRDDSGVDCALGIQVALSGHTWDGDYVRETLKSLSGPDRETVGIRPGGLYYSEAAPRDLIPKFFNTVREAARAKKFGNVGPICYETENYPHVALKKNPHGQMEECALAIAAGCDSIAFYNAADCNGEYAENNKRYYEVLADRKPYLEAVRDKFNGTSPGGVAFFHGSRFFDNAWWGKDLGFAPGRDHYEPDAGQLFVNGVPTTVTEAAALVHALNARCVDTLGKSDLDPLFSKPVMMDVAAFKAFRGKFPKHPLSKAVRVVDASNETQAAIGAAKCREEFGRYHCARVCGAYVTAKGGAIVTPFSRIPNVAGGAGTCTVVLPDGGKAVLMQGYPSDFIPWTGPCRDAILDALDSVLPYGMPVRLKTSGYAVGVVAGVNDKGAPRAALLFNFGMGPTPRMAVEFRNRGKKRTVTIQPVAAFASATAHCRAPVKGTQPG